jgi:hypothetical protein
MFHFHPVFDKMLIYRSTLVDCQCPKVLPWAAYQVVSRACYSDEVLHMVLPLIFLDPTRHYPRPTLTRPECPRLLPRNQSTANIRSMLEMKSSSLLNYAESRISLDSIHSTSKGYAVMSGVSNSSTRPSSSKSSYLTG